VSVTSDIRQTPTHLHVTVTGAYTLQGIKDVLMRIRQAADDYQSTRILVDCRELTGDPPLRERFEIVAFVLQQRINAILHGKPSRVATAIVARRPLVHPGRYGLRLLVERNLKATICEDMAEALAWLGVEVQPSEPAASP
jgi:hypothetical protein